MDQGVSIYNADLNCVVCNQAFVDFLGLSGELAQPGARLVDLVDFLSSPTDYGPRDLEALIRRRLDLVADSSFCAFDGLPPRNSDIEIRQTRPPEGGLVLTLTDVPKCRQISDRSQFQAEIINQIQEAVVVTTIDGVITFWNAAAAKLWGYSASEAIGQHNSMLHADCVPQTAESDLIPILRQGVKQYAARQYKRKDGEVFWGRLSLSVLDNADGAAVAMIGCVEDITERKRAEDALKRSEREYRNLIDESPQGILITRDNKIIYANQAKAEMHGYTVDELIGMDVGQLLPPSELKRILALRVLEKIRHIELRTLTRDGGEIWTVGNAMNIQWEGLPARLSATVNITGHKHALAQLEASELQLRTTLDTLTDAIITIEERGTILSFNPAAERIFGYDAQNVIGKNVQILMPPAMARMHNESLGKLIENADRAIEPRRREVTGRRADGTLFPIEIDINEMSSDGRRRFVGSLRDITERQQTERILSRQALALASLSEGVVMTDLRQKIVDCNAAVESLFGYSRNELIGKSVCKLLTHPGKWEPATVTAMGDQASPVRDFTEVQCLRQDGTSFDGERLASPLYDKAGTLAGTVCVWRDVTERKKTEAMLRQSQKMEAVGQLTGGIAHDFNNLLAIIQGNLELILDGMTDDKEVIHRISRALDATGRGAKLVRHLLIYSRTQRLSPTILDVGDVVGEMGELMKRSIGGRAQIKTEFERDQWPVKIDRSQLENAILNLAINARDAMAGGGTITITTANLDVDRAVQEKHPFLKTGHYVTITVCDNGVGMAPEVVKHAFDPFFTTKPVGQGSGLGLSMVFGFVKQSGGYVTIDSAVGVGTKVALHLPRYSEAASLVEPDRVSAAR